MLATTRIDVFRGVVLDDYEDTADAPILPLDGTPEPGVVYASPVTPEGGVPASLIQKDRRDFNPETGEVRTVRMIRGRCALLFDFAAGDRVRDRRTGVVYALDGFTVAPRTLAGAAAVRFDLRGTLG